MEFFFNKRCERKFGRGWSREKKIEGWGEEIRGAKTGSSGREKNKVR